MADDIEEFLKRVAEKRRGQQGARPQSQQPQQKPPQRPPQQRQQPARPPAPQAPPPVVTRPPLAEIIPTVDTSIHQISTTEVQQHAQQYMSRAEFETRSMQVGLHAKPLAHLESNVAKVRADREQQSPASRLVETQVSAPITAESPLAALMKSREAFRSAFLLSLVIDRPAWKDE